MKHLIAVVFLTLMATTATADWQASDLNVNPSGNEYQSVIDISGPLVATIVCRPNQDVWEFSLRSSLLGQKRPINDSLWFVMMVDEKDDVYVSVDNYIDVVGTDFRHRNTNIFIKKLMQGDTLNIGIVNGEVSKTAITLDLAGLTHEIRKLPCTL